MAPAAVTGMHKRDGDGDWGSGQGPCSSQGSSSCGKALDSPWLHSVEGQRLFRKMGTGKVLSDPQCMQNPKFTLQLSEVDGVTSILHVGLGETHPEPSTHCLCLCRVQPQPAENHLARGTETRPVPARAGSRPPRSCLGSPITALQGRAFVRSDLSEGRRPVRAPECLRFLHLLLGVRGSPALLKPLQV